jgi:hypothetical protein
MLLARCLRASERETTTPRQAPLGVGGSGSTLIATDQNRPARLLMELGPLYAEVRVRPCEQFPGKKAKRFADELPE